MDSVADHWIGVIDASDPAPLLYPATAAMPKCLLPIFDKPLIYHPFSVLMLANVRRFVLICQQVHECVFQRLLGDGSQFGIEIDYVVGESHGALATSLLLARRQIGNRNVAWISGDCVLYADQLQEVLNSAMANREGSTILLHQSYRGRHQTAVSLCADGGIAKAADGASDGAAKLSVINLSFHAAGIVGILDSLNACEPRTQLHDTDLFLTFQTKQWLSMHICGRGFAWLDTSTLDHINAAANFIEALQATHGLKVGCPEEIALRKGYLTAAQILSAIPRTSNAYADYVRQLAARSRD